MAGRPRKPTAIKRLEGNPGKRPLNDLEPQYPGAPEMPNWLPKEAKAEWEKITKELSLTGLVQKVDKAMLTGYVVAWANFEEAEKIMKKKGRTFEIPKFNKEGELISTYYQIRPEVTISNNAMTQIIKFCQEFGLSPSSRTRLTVNKAKQKDEMEDLLD